MGKRGGRTELGQTEDNSKQRSEMKDERGLPNHNILNCRREDIDRVETMFFTSILKDLRHQTTIEWWDDFLLSIFRRRGSIQKKEM